MKRVFYLWIAAVLITGSAFVLQRYTGPTYPKKVSAQINDTTILSLSLPRSGYTDEEVKIEMPPVSWDWSARLYHRPYPTDKEWELNPPFWPEEGVFVSYLPEVSQKAAKLAYYIELENSYEGTTIVLPPDEPVVIRYKGAVPAWALLPHIILMSIALLFSTLTGLHGAYGNPSFRLWGFITALAIFLGGLVFGPVVQKFAFGEFWAGFPFGYDLTDNKTFIMFVVWAIACIVNRKKGNRTVTVVASVITLVIYLIPHSLRGSEFNYETGEVVTGVINLVPSIF
ncbi:MAG: hypothetical protein PHD00_01125 [Bacteroidales bacterium]|nr:hypothetical protein [Bacteroidales bacterium]MDD4672534.1 hypothetical protein [Bacteroidales bacterium]